MSAPQGFDRWTERRQLRRMADVLDDIGERLDRMKLGLADLAQTMGRSDETTERMIEELRRRNRARRGL